MDHSLVAANPQHTRGATKTTVGVVILLPIVMHNPAMNMIWSLTPVPLHLLPPRLLHLLPPRLGHLLPPRLGQNNTRWPLQEVRSAPAAFRSFKPKKSVKKKSPQPRTLPKLFRLAPGVEQALVQTKLVVAPGTLMRTFISRQRQGAVDQISMRKRGKPFA